MKQYFTTQELCHSDTAVAKHIDNTPTKEVESNLKRLIDFLNPLREKWGSGIRINSGYRCPALNKEVGGVATSAHTTGNAVDLWPINNKFDDFCKFILNYLDATKSWDQCIIEQSGTSRWVHLGLFNNQGKQRKMKFEIKCQH